jgi:O-antigen ligase
MTARGWDPTDLYDLRIRPLWSAFLTEGLAFWLLCAYMMFEYVRPQSVYPALAVLPWTTACMAGTAVAALVSARSVRVSTPATGFLAIYSFVVVLSSLSAYSPSWAFGQFDSYFLWVALYLIIIYVVTTETRMLLLVLAFVLYNFKMSLFATRSWVAIGFAFRDWGTGGAPGWFQNSGEFGIEMCVFFPIVTYLAVGLRPYLPKWKFLALLGISGTSLVGMVASSSRGALLGGAAVIMFMLARSKYKFRAAVAGVVVGTIFILAIPPQQMNRLSASGADKTSQERLVMWKHGVGIVNDNPLLGVGYGNWLPYYRDHFDSNGLVCHNIFLQAASEMGYIGLAAFLLLIGCTFWMNAKSRARAAAAGPRGRLIYHLALGLDGALIGYMVSGFFVTVLYYPYFWVNFAMTAALGTAAKQFAGVPAARRRHAWQQRAPVFGNAGASGAPLRPALPPR